MIECNQLPELYKINSNEGNGGISRFDFAEKAILTVKCLAILNKHVHRSCERHLYNIVNFFLVFSKKNRLVTLLNMASELEDTTKFRYDNRKEKHLVRSIVA